jgi:hypothetical protein
LVFLIHTELKYGCANPNGFTALAEGLEVFMVRNLYDKWQCIIWGGGGIFGQEEISQPTKQRTVPNNQTASQPVQEVTKDQDLTQFVIS